MQNAKPDTNERAGTRRGVRFGAAAALALAAGLAAWAVFAGGGSAPPSITNPPAASASSKPVALSQRGLATIAAAVGQPIYWAGPRAGYRYELTRLANGNVYVRYLPPGVAAGVRSADYLTVATYPFRHAYAALARVSKGSRIRLRGGGIAAVDEANPKSIHLAFPGIDFQVEVYDPSPAEARSVATSGSVVSVK